MAANTPYFGDGLDFILKRGNESCVFSNDQNLDSLNSLIEKMATATVKFVMPRII